MSIIIFDFFEVFIYKIEIYDYNVITLKGGVGLNSFIIKKLKEGRANAKLKQSEVAEKIGIKGNTLSNYENGVSEPDIDTFCALCDIYGIDPSSILNEAYGLGVQGEDFKIKPSEIEHIKKYRDLDDHGKEMVDLVLSKESDRVKQVNKFSENSLSTATRLISYYYRNASAGTGQIIIDNLPEKDIEIPDIPKYKCVSYAVGVNGSSMEPTFSDGDILLVEATNQIEINEIGIFQIDSQCYVKKLGQTELISLNSEYENIPLDETSTTLGKVIDKLSVQY